MAHAPRRRHRAGAVLAPAGGLPARVAGRPRHPHDCVSPGGPVRPWAAAEADADTRTALFAAAMAELAG
ncbi:hypothetical protein PV417_08110 [Streptomyces sp. ME19-03-3]|nr:hypothetical protein [Streptomyces sp. ME19-03-3]